MGEIKERRGKLLGFTAYFDAFVQNTVVSALIFGEYKKSRKKSEKF